MNLNKPEQLDLKWKMDARWRGIKRNYKAEDVFKLRSSILIKHTLAEVGSERLWKLLHEKEAVRSLGALTGNQAIQQVRAGLKAVYVSGWQVAADANSTGQMYPDQSLYPVNSVPEVVKKINQALLRSDEISNAEGKNDHYWLAPLIADAEAGFGGALNSYELMKSLIQAGASGVHFEDQLASEKKCGHMGGKVLVPTSQFIKTLTAARLAADVLDVPTLLIARTDANGAKLITSDYDTNDSRFIENTGRTSDGFYRLKGGLDCAIARGIAYAPYADLVWCETSTPNLIEAKKFAEAVHKEYPGKLLAYNCSPSFNWKKHLSSVEIAKFQTELNAMGYKYQFVTLAGFHSLNYSMFDLAHGYKENEMSAYSNLQEREFAAESLGYTATKHQKEVGTGYFDLINQVISEGKSETLALKGSTEEEQFHTHYVGAY